MVGLTFVLLVGAFSQAISSPLAATDVNLGTIIFSSVLFRHGDRAPTQSYPTDPYNDVKKYWPRGYGQLTKLGEEQQYKLGRFLRKRYAEILPATYNVNDTHVRSTDVDRTLTSALCNLAGLYPPTENITGIPFQAVPVHTEQYVNDKLLQPSSSCKKYASILSLVRKSEEYQCVNNTLKDVQAQVARYAGHDTFKSYIYDTLHVQDIYNLTLPTWTKSYYPSPLREFDLFEYFITSAATTELQRLAVGPLLKEVIGNMKLKARGSLDPNRSLFIYSAHDGNVLDALQALHVFNGKMIPYTATVLIELRVKSDQHYVTVSYKNGTDEGPHLLQLPGCESLCPLNKFIELTKDVVPDDESKECEEELQPGTPVHIQIPEAAILPEWKHCFGHSSTMNEAKHFFINK